jgi:hypothetical protein
MKRVVLAIAIATVFASCSNNTTTKSGLMGGDSAQVSADTMGVLEIEDSIHAEMEKASDSTEVK